MISGTDLKNDGKRSEFGLGSAFFGISDPGLVKKSFLDTFVSQKLTRASWGRYLDKKCFTSTQNRATRVQKLGYLKILDLVGRVYPSGGCPVSFRHRAHTRVQPGMICFETLSVPAHA